MFLDEINMHSRWITIGEHSDAAFVRHGEIALANNVHANQHVGMGAESGLRYLQMHETYLVGQSDVHKVELGIYLTIRLIPPPVWVDARREADAWLAQRQSKPKSYWAAAFVVLVWLAVAYWAWTVVREHW